MNNKGFKNWGFANNSATKTQDTNTFTTGTGSDESTCTVKDGSIAEVVLSGRTATNLLGTRCNAVSDWTAQNWLIDIANVVDGGVQIHTEASGHGYLLPCDIPATHVFFVAVKSALVSGVPLKIQSKEDDSVLKEVLSSSASLTRQGFVVQVKATAIENIYVGYDSGEGTEEVENILPVDLTTDYPDLLTAMCVDPANPTTDEKTALATWCLANIPYFSNTVSVDPQSLVSCGRNLFDKDMVTVDTWVNTDGSLAVSAQDNCSSDYIPVIPGIKYYLLDSPNSENNPNANTAWYTASKEMVAGSYSSSAQIRNGATAPATACYMRTTVNTADLSSAMITTSPALPYEPYWSDTLDLSGIGTFATGATSDKYRVRVRNGGQIVLTDDNDLAIPSSIKYHTCKNQGFKNI